MRAWRNGLARAALALLLLLPATALADDTGEGQEIYRRGADSGSGKARGNGAPVDLAPLWEHRDAALQAKLESAIRQLGLDGAVRGKQLSFALVDITELHAPRVAELNGDLMMYAASLPKIAVLLAVFDGVEKGKIRLDTMTENKLKQMIRRSSNSATTEMMHLVGKENIAEVLLSPRYRLYDPKRNGGLWVGKDYGKGGLWRRDPLHNLSHGATAMQVARFYYLLETGKLVSPRQSAKMKQILADSEINHKFVHGLLLIDPKANLYRKSGSWRTYHSDSALVERDGRAYIAVALANSDKGKHWLVDLIQAADAIIFSDDRPRRAKKKEKKKRSFRDLFGRRAR